MPHGAKANCTETHHRAHRKIDSARDENWSKCEGEQTDLGAETNALEEIVQRKEIPARDAEQDDLERDQDRKRYLLSAVRFQMKGYANSTRRPLQLPIASTRTAAKMIPPCIAFSQ